MTRDDAKTLDTLERICWRLLQEYLPASFEAFDREHNAECQAFIEVQGFPHIVPLLEILERCGRVRGEFASVWPEEEGEPVAAGVLARDAAPYEEPPEESGEPSEPDVCDVIALHAGRVQRQGGQE